MDVKSNKVIPPNDCTPIQYKLECIVNCLRIIIPRYKCDIVFICTVCDILSSVSDQSGEGFGVLMSTFICQKDKNYIPVMKLLKDRYFTPEKNKVRLTMNTLYRLAREVEPKLFLKLYQDQHQYVLSDKYLLPDNMCILFHTVCNMEIAHCDQQWYFYSKC